MRILIVDDEPLVRIGIKSAIDWEAEGMEIVGEAGDGEEAVRLMLERKPDVVMLDIKMPKKDGLDVLAEMKEKGITAKAIILSSFDDFMHVKEAMKLGAVDYFHKPGMNEQEIKKALKHVKENLNPIQQTGAAELNHRVKAATLEDMLSGAVDGALETKLKENNIFIVLFTVKKYTAVVKRYTGQNTAILPNTIANILFELLSKEKESEFVQLEDNLYTICVSHSESKSVQAAFSHVNDLVYTISSSLKRFLNIETVFGVSRVFHSFGGFKQAAGEAKQALEQRFYHPNDPLFYYEPRKIEEEQAMERINDLIVLMKNRLKAEKYDEFAVHLAQWEQYVQDTEFMSERDVKKIYEGLLFMMQDGEEYLEGGGDAEHIEEFNELSAYYHAVFNEKLTARIAGKNKDYSPLTRNIIQFIDKHYNENISLKMLGEQFHASPNYISRLFKQETERGLFDYINEVRIHNAKELLKDYKYKIYEVAEMVGYNSQAHFAIVFHKYAGVSPKEYRKEKG
ncbi:response regulator transcription factor [Paenibacillus abyssi]|uniref:DNA-binding response regulator n=1 Tax=Paenibacillus abyssi TaxID=1340531 RepID=A0A917CZG4_9BACL|nr:response regulator [Paenibacillus abyssi]GGG04100.1 DNA-binding response regulator [Paenibacillus abyssi]